MAHIGDRHPLHLIDDSRRCHRQILLASGPAVYHRAERSRELGNTPQHSLNAGMAVQRVSLDLVPC